MSFKPVCSPPIRHSILGEGASVGWPDRRAYRGRPSPKGWGELQAGRKLAGPGEGRVREVGGGRKKMEETDPAVPELLPKILGETTAGDARSWLRWTCKC